MQLASRLVQLAAKRLQAFRAGRPGVPHPLMDRGLPIGFDAGLGGGEWRSWAGYPSLGGRSAGFNEFSVPHTSI